MQKKSGTYLHAVGNITLRCEIPAPAIHGDFVSLYNTKQVCRTVTNLISFLIDSIVLFLQDISHLGGG